MMKPYNLYYRSSVTSSHLETIYLHLNSSLERFFGKMRGFETEIEWLQAKWFSWRIVIFGEERVLQGLFHGYPLLEVRTRLFLNNSHNKHVTGKTNREITKSSHKFNIAGRHCTYTWIKNENPGEKIQRIFGCFGENSLQRNWRVLPESPQKMLDLIRVASL